MEDLPLRERNRISAMQRITNTAMDLFDDHGYHEVTVEEIAAAAGVSPRTFYRYFGSKEGLFTTDIHAAAGHDLITDRIDPNDLPGTVQRIVEAIASAPVQSTAEHSPWRGMRYVLEEPAVRAAVYGALDVVCDQIAALVQAAGMGPTQARVVTRAYVFGVYLGALEQWHLDGRTRSLRTYVRKGISALGKTLPVAPSRPPTAR